MVIHGILGYSKCMLQRDGDMCTMIFVCMQMNMNRVNIEVNVRVTEDDMNEGEVGANTNVCNGSWSL